MIVRGVPAVVLAPMEGVTDAPMRAFLSELGGWSFCVSEFLRVSQEIPPKRVILDHVPEAKRGWKTASGTTVTLQLLGGDPEKLAEAAQLACQLGAPAVDLNFGCPAPTVNRHDGGATLLKYPDRIRAIVEAVRKAVPTEVPVSAKFRLGWDSLDPIHLNSERAAEGGASWITIHGRTKMQGYIPPAYWGPIGQVKRRLGIPVVANGEIWTIEDFNRCREETDCEHFMLGRGALADPWLAHRVSAALGGKTLDTDRPDWVPLIERFSEICESFLGPDVVSPHSPGGLESPRPGRRNGYIVRRVKQWLRQASLRKTFASFDQVKRAESLEEFWALLNAPESVA